MTQAKVYEAAREVLKGLDHIPMGQFLFGESLFLMRHCLRDANGGYNVVASFDERDLEALIKIAQAVLQRSPQYMVH